RRAAWRCCARGRVRSRGEGAWWSPRLEAGRRAGSSGRGPGPTRPCTGRASSSKPSARAARYVPLACLSVVSESPCVALLTEEEEQEHACDESEDVRDVRDIGRRLMVRHAELCERVDDLQDDEKTDDDERSQPPCKKMCVKRGTNSPTVSCPCEIVPANVDQSNEYRS